MAQAVVRVGSIRLLGGMIGRCVTRLLSALSRTSARAHPDL